MGPGLFAILLESDPLDCQVEKAIAARCLGEVHQILDFDPVDAAWILRDRVGNSRPGFKFALGRCERFAESAPAIES